MSIEKTCGECQKVFHVRPSASDKQFCSMKCYHVVRTRKSRKPCPICNKEMRAWFDFCSKKCSAKSRSTSYEAQCKHCGKSFTTHPSAEGKFCSRRCCSDWQIGQEHVERLAKPCAYCGEEMTGTPVELEKMKFCSRTCSDKNKTREAGHGNGSDLNRQCVVCGESFTVERPCRTQKTCSHKCGGELMVREHNERMEQLLPEIKEYRKLHTPVETAERYEMSPSALVNWGVVGPEAEKRASCPDQLTPEQEEVMVGNLLGDGCVSYIDKNRGRGGSNNHFSIGQKAERAEYINGLFKIYSPFSCGTHERQNRKPSRVDGKINHDIENWNGEYTSSIMMYTVAHPVFTALRQKWYKEPDVKRSPKIIPADLRLTWRTAAIWMCDDGTNYVKKRHRALALYTDCFSYGEVEFLVDRIKKDLGVSARINLRDGKPTIKIYGDEWFKFIEGIKPFIPWECLQYKCINREKFAQGCEVGDGRWLFRIKTGKTNLDDVLKKRGWELLSEYTDREMQVRCEHGEVFTRIRASLMKPACRCDCIPKTVNVLQRAEEKLRTFLATKNWELASEYTGFFKYVKLKCQHGKEFERLPGNIKPNSKCDCEKLAKSGLVGVTEEKSGKWKSVACIGGERKSLGTYDTKEEAAAAREAYMTQGVA
jgi:hypothetical protein